MEKVPHIKTILFFQLYIYLIKLDNLVKLLGNHRCTNRAFFLSVLVLAELGQPSVIFVLIIEKLLPILIVYVVLVYVILIV